LRYANRQTDKHTAHTPAIAILCTITGSKLIIIQTENKTNTYIRPAGRLKAKFHYTGPTGPDQTRLGSPTKSADFVWSGPVGLV